VTVAISDAEFLMVRFCSYTVRTIGLLSDYTYNLYMPDPCQTHLPCRADGEVSRQSVQQLQWWEFATESFHSTNHQKHRHYI